MGLGIERFLVAISLAAGCTLAVPGAARADRNTLGVHFGFNFDVDDPLIGAEGRFDIARVGGSAVLQINPTFSYYFTDNIDLFNFSLNLPFEFRINDSVLRPFIAPGLGIMHASWNGGSDTDVKFNLIGGLLFYLPPVEPFVQLKVALGDDTYAEIVGGILFEL